MAREEHVSQLFDLAARKGYDITKAVLGDHYRLVDPTGEIVKRQTGSAAFGYAEAMEYLEKLPDRK